MRLEEAVRIACEKMQATGIPGWGLHVPKSLGGEVVEVRRTEGCTSSQCRHNSHDPAAATYKWLPPTDSRLVLLGSESNQGVDYYVLRGDTWDIGLKVEYQSCFHAGIDIIPVETLPAWALAQMAEHPAGADLSDPRD